MSKKNRYSAIDFGSNSIRLMIADFDGVEFKNKFKTKETTRLRSELSEDGSLSLSRIKKSVDAAKKFLEIVEREGAAKPYCYATSAVREAPNGKILAEALRELGLELHILSGDEEAAMAYRGARFGLKASNKSFHPRIMTIDVGGGSTELCLGEGDKIISRKSYKIGVVSLLDSHFTGGDELGGMNASLNEIEDLMGDDLDGYINELPFEAVLIGGTATTIGLNALMTDEYDEEALNGLDVGTDEIRHFMDSVFVTPKEDRKNIVGVSEDRADILLQGLIIFEFLLKNMGLRRALISEYDTLEGGIIENFDALTKIQR